MPLFIKSDNPIVVWRQYEFNAEALDGRITLISNTEPCVLLAHHPNPAWGYNIGVIKTLSAEEGWVDVENLGHKQDGPHIFYELVPTNKYPLYLETNPEYSDNLETAQEPEPVPPITEPEPTVIDIPKITIDPPGFKENKKKLVQTRLMKDSEAPIYKYRAPGKRF